MELGHFNKYFVKNTIKKAPQGKILEFFLLDTVTITFWMEKLNKAFLPKSEHFFQFPKKGRDTSPRLVARCSHICKYRCTKNEVFH